MQRQVHHRRSSHHGRLEKGCNCCLCCILATTTPLRGQPEALIDAGKGGTAKTCGRSKMETRPSCGAGENPQAVNFEVSIVEEQRALHAQVAFASMLHQTHQSRSVQPTGELTMGTLADESSQKLRRQRSEGKLAAPDTTSKAHSK